MKHDALVASSEPSLVGYFAMKSRFDGQHRPCLGFHRMESATYVEQEAERLTKNCPLLKHMPPATTQAPAGVPSITAVLENETFVAM